MNKHLRSALLTLVFLMALFLTDKGYGQQLPITGPWKYSFTDNDANSKISTNDKDWKEKDANTLSWKKSELDGNGQYTWIRKSIVIPSALKEELTKTGSLALYLGRIYQSDDTYFNERLVGSTNSSDIRRIYILPTSAIKWDAENTIAIKMQHWGDRCGLDKVPNIAVASANAIFKVTTVAAGEKAKQPVAKTAAVYRCSIINKSEKEAQGIIETTFFDFDNKLLYADKKELVIKSGSNDVDFNFTPASPFLKIEYKLIIPGYDFVTTWYEELGYAAVNYKTTSPIVPNAVPEHFVSADLNNQVVKGWLGDRMNANVNLRLHQVDEAALLAGYINRPGSHPWIGEHVGKFLDAATNAYKNNADPALKIQLDRTAQQLIASQLPDGYLGTYPAEDHWTSWDVWSHKYNIIGLLNYYSLSGYAPALEAARKAGNLLCSTFGTATGQRDIIAAGTHEGMAATSILEPMADLYRFTGNKRYLAFCNYIIESYNQANGPKIITTLSTLGRTDKTANAKAYEMLSNLVGIVKLYRVTGDESLIKPVLAAWKDIVAKRLYITGTASSFEHFQDDDLLPATDKDNMGEGCVTTTWLQLNYQLLCIYGSMEYLDEVERSVYNHLTGAENPETGCVSYYTPLVGVKPYRCVITCCMSSVPRGIAMIPLLANGQLNNQPSFLFYQPGTYKTKVNGSDEVSFITTTNFSEEGKINITVNAKTTAKFAVAFRKPYWAEHFSISVNGKVQLISQGETTSLDRAWKNGDQISVSFTMPVKVIDGGKSYAGFVALQRGPQVLAFDKNLNITDQQKITIDPKQVTLQKGNSVLPAKWVGAQAWLVDGKAAADQKILLVPYADASQTGGAITTWLKSSSGK